MSIPFFYGTDTLSVESALSLAAGTHSGRLDETATRRVLQSQEAVQEIVRSGRTVYGINTGFGILADTAINEADTRLLQHKILQSHSVGVGDPIPPQIAKLMLITKVQALVQGFSGVQLSTLERIIWHIENDVIPVVPEKGSVGASGDLAPLAHLFLPLIGLGEVFHKGVRTASRAVLQQHGLEPIALGPKEGLALINGTQFILAFAIKAVQRMLNCLEAA